MINPEIVTELQAIARSNETARNLMHYFAKRQRVRDEPLSLSWLKTRLHGVDDEQYNAVFPKLEELKLGKVTTDKNGKPTSFRFNEAQDLVATGQAAVGNLRETRANRSNQTATHSRLIIYRQLADNQTIRIDMPSSITRDELSMVVQDIVRDLRI